jgi:DNA-binding Lrp family transcriptional regulator
MEKSSVRYFYPEAAYVMINCEMGYELPVSEELKTITGITEIERTVGNYDIIAKIEVETVESLRDIIAFRIRRVGGVLSTTTLMCTDPTMPMISQ